MERAGHARAESRLTFAIALRWHREFWRVPSDYLHAVEALCLVHSLELGLKAFALFEAGRAPRGHDLNRLFQMLSPGLQSRIAADTRDPKERFDASLKLARNVFKKRRNVDRYEAPLVGADLGFLQRFARAVQKTLYGRAPATRKAAARADSGTSGDNRMSRKRPANLSCSFCGKGDSQVRRLIAGPTAHICDECVLLCSEIIAEELAGRGTKVRHSGRRV